ncbi:MAG: hypothetical protein R2708_24955 [Vicinamibacterales bacterium]
MRDRRGLYRQWVLANGLSEAVGLGTTFALGTLLAPRLAAASGLVAVLGGAVLAVLLGTFLEGVVVGWAQGRVLARHSSIAPTAWIRASALGAGLAWLLGMVPSTVMALVAGDAPPGEATPMPEPGPLVTYALAAGLGAITGPILGAVQWRVLKTAVPHAGRWLWANALAWAVGMPVIFAGMDLVPWSGSAAARALALYLVCLVAGVAVGLVHGRVLLGLLREAPPTP